MYRIRHFILYTMSSSLFMQLVILNDIMRRCMQIRNTKKSVRRARSGLGPHCDVVLLKHLHIHKNHSIKNMVHVLWLLCVESRDSFCMGCDTWMHAHYIPHPHSPSCLTCPPLGHDPAFLRALFKCYICVEVKQTASKCKGLLILLLLDPIMVHGQCKDDGNGVWVYFPY